MRKFKHTKPISSKADIVITNWKKQRKLVSIACGVYIVVIDTICVYVGMSKHLRTRLGDYFENRRSYSITNKTFRRLLDNSRDTRIYVFYTGTLAHAILLEQELIQELTPFFNLEYASPSKRRLITYVTY